MSQGDNDTEWAVVGERIRLARESNGMSPLRRQAKQEGAEKQTIEHGRW